MSLVFNVIMKILLESFPFLCMMVSNQLNHTFGITNKGLQLVLLVPVQCLAHPVS